MFEAGVGSPLPGGRNGCRASVLIQKILKVIVLVGATGWMVGDQFPEG